MPVGLMLASVTSAELTEWMAYLRVKAEDEEAEREKAAAPAARNLR